MAAEGALSFEDLIARFESFLDEYGYDVKLMEVVDKFPDERSLYIRFSDIDRFDRELAEYLLEHPYDVIGAAEQAVKRKLSPAVIGEKKIDRIYVRITNLPPVKDVLVDVREIRSKHVGKFIAVEGLIRRITDVRPKIVDAFFQCVRCGRIIRIPQEGMVLREPLECPKDQGGCGKGRGATAFKPLGEKSILVDTQKVELQEALERLRGGAQPQRLAGWVEGDLTGKLMVGDKIVLNGVVRTYVREERRRTPTRLDIFLDINSFDLKEKEFEEIEILPEEEAKILELAAGGEEEVFRKIVASISPTIFGLQIEKEALALQLFGGVPKHMPDGTRIRGDIHILLVGDPGTAKSQILRYISELAPRGIYAAGKTASAAGLTAAAVRDETFGEGRWVLEAGALVLADMGVAAVDEIDKMSKEDRSGMHEVMEQQTVSVAKAGITATLQARCAVLGAANPQFGRFDEHRYIAEQINLPPTLLSRFDIIFSIIDKPKATVDELIADHIIHGHYVGETLRVKSELATEVEGGKVAEYIESLKPELPQNFLKKYIAYARRKYFPVMTEEAMNLIKEYYLKIRKRGEAAGASVPITPRQLEAIIRLSEASARARLSNKVMRPDAERAIRIIEYYLSRVAGEPGTGTFDIDIIATGKSRAQWEAVKIMTDIISKLCAEKGDAPHTEIIKEAENYGIDSAKAELYIKRLRDEGMIYERTLGKYRLARSG